MTVDAKKSLGQNFLIDDGIARRIVDAARIAPDDVVIEIGPGTGALTRHLVQRARRVIAIELDARMLPLLPAHEALHVVHGDALEVNIAALCGPLRPGQRVTFVGNLPYYITSALLRIMLECGLPTRAIVATVQLEVAQRIMARPGDLSLLAVSVQFYGVPELIMRIPPAAFQPQPGVDSAVLRITPRPEPLPVAPADFFAMARAGFSQPRKQLRNPLAAGLAISKPQADVLLRSAGIDPTRRAETLSIAEWAGLARARGELQEKSGEDRI